MLELGSAADREIWSRAGADGYVLVTKDEDFHRLSVLFGPRPKVVWIRSSIAVQRSMSEPRESTSATIDPPPSREPRFVGDLFVKVHLRASRGARRGRVVR